MDSCGSVAARLINRLHVPVDVCLRRVAFIHKICLARLQVLHDWWGTLASLYRLKRAPVATFVYFPRPLLPHRLQRRLSNVRRILGDACFGLTHRCHPLEAPVLKRFWKRVNIDESNGTLARSVLCRHF